MVKNLIKKNQNPGEKQQVVSYDILYSLFHKVNVAVMVMDKNNGAMLYFNEKVCDDLELNCSEIEGKSYTDIFSPDFIKLYDKLVADCEDGNVHTVVYYWATKFIWEQISARQINWEDDKTTILLNITNITEVAKAEYEFERLAYFDPKTGLPNSKRLESDINKLADVETVALIYVQVEGFYDINDLYGFDVGDALIKQIIDWLTFSESKVAQIYRGNEGIICLGHYVTLEETKQRASQIVKRFTHPWKIGAGTDEISIYCHCKVGVVYGKYVRNEMRTLLLRSLRAPVTEEGFSIYDEEADSKAKYALAIRQTLTNCVHNNMEGFSVSYQPIVDGKTGKWVGAEALCRWKTPDGEIVPPIIFINLCEKLDLISVVDNWVREKAMNDCMSWGMDNKKFFLDINFSSMQAVDDFFIDKLVGNLNKTGYPPAKLVMEITESERMEFNDSNLKGLERQKKLGIQFSLDDFGTGYSSFENLIKVPATYLKTEKVFLKNIENNKYKQYLLKMLIKLAHYLNLKIVCEGVETDEQKELLRKYGVDLMQGFLFSKPLREEEFKDAIWHYEDH